MTFMRDENIDTYVFKYPLSTLHVRLQRHLLA